MEVITINGKKFTKAANVAREFGYASDYVGQLARSGAVRAERVGRAWYVDRDEVAAHKGEKRRSVAARARAGLVERVHVVKRANETVRHVSGISYHDGDAPLMPQILHTPLREAPVSRHDTEEVFLPEETLLNELPSDTLGEKQEEELQVYRVPIRKVEGIKKNSNIIANGEDTPYGEYQIHEKKQVPTVVFAKRNDEVFEPEYLSNAPYIFLIGLAMIVLFTSMYTYTEGVVKQSGITKSYGVSVNIVNALTMGR